MSVRTAESLARRAARAGAARRVVSTAAVVAVTAGLAVAGTDLFGAGAHDATPGVAVVLGEQASTLVCPAPVALAEGATGTGDDEFGSSPVAPRSTVQLAVFGDRTTSTLDVLAAPQEDGVAGDAATDDPASRTVVGDDPSAQLSLDDVASALLLSSVATTDPTATPTVGASDDPTGDPGADPDAAGGTGGATSAPQGAAEDASAQAYASMASVTAAGDLRGLAAAACQEPGISQWLVGGGTELGTSTELVLQNPSQTPATVTVQLWGASGELVLAGPSTYLVPPGGQVTTLVGGLAAEQNRVVAHVSATGALITSYLQHNVLDGLTPTGVDFVVPGSGPGTSQVLTGLSVEASEVSTPDVATLRVLATEEDGTATISVLGADGQLVLRGAQTLDLVAGSVSDVSLAGLPAGTYTVLVQADVPVVAGAQVTSTGLPDEDRPLVGTPKDRAWVAARHDASGGRASAAVPAGTRASVALTALPGTLDEDALAQVPIDYSGLEAAEGSTEATTDPLAAGWTAAPRGELRAYGTDGSLLGSTTVSLAIGQTVLVDLATLSGDEQVGAVTVVPAQSGATAGADVPAEVVLDWSVVLRAPGVSGSVAVLAPTTLSAGTDTLVVRRSAAVGLPTG